MDTQVVGEDTLDNEWAVDRIKSHSGAKTDAVFEILWKSGDATWLPYYQITHLQALTDYLELIGVSQIAKLPSGHGQPPLDDPQLFLGSITLCQPTSQFLPCPPFANLFHYIKPLLLTISALLHRPSPTPFASPTVDLCRLLLTMPKVRGVKHPSFKRVSATHYLIREPDSSLNSTIHVGQIADYLKFDEQLRLHGGMLCLQSMPLGFPGFANLWNAGARDGKQISRVYLPDYSDEYHVDICTNPINLDNFHITAEQVGLAPPHYESSNNPVNREIIQEFATIMMEQRRNSRRGFENRQDRRLRPFSQGPASQPKAVLSRLQFKHKPRHSAPSAPVERSPSPVPLEVSQLDEELEEFVDQSVLPPAEEPVRMETAT